MIPLLAPRRRRPPATCRSSSTRSAASTCRPSFRRARSTPTSSVAIAREAGASIGGKIYADSLGPKGSAGETYVDALSADAAALVDGMSADG